MLKVNVGLSRKLSRDFNSTGFTLNLEGEICASVDDPETLIEKIKEFYDLADEALGQQIERYESESAIASRDEEPIQPNQSNQATRPSNTGFRVENTQRRPAHNGNGDGANGEPATNKQIQYLLNLGKRQGLTSTQLEEKITEILSQQVGVYDLTKRQAGTVIDVLSQNNGAVANGRGRHSR